MISIDKKQINGSLLLLLTSLIWGSSFVSQRIGMNYIDPFTFNCIRSFIGALVLLPVIFFTDRKSSAETRQKEKLNNKTLLLSGVICGVILAIASSLQQHGINYTSVGKAGFITSLYVVMVPIFGIFLKKKVKPIFWLSVALATIGMYLLCINESLTLGIGDFLIFLCSIGFAIHIMVIDYFSPKVNCLKMACIQLFVSGIICAFLMFVFENPNINSILSAYLPLLYSGILSCGVAYTLQMTAQKDVNPVVASLILSLESVICTLSSWIVLGEQLSTKEIFGCIIIFSGIILAQIPFKKESAVEKVKREATII